MKKKAMLSKEKLVLTIFFSVFIILAFHNSAFAGSNFPSKTVTIISPWAPGGAADTVSRWLASLAGEYLGQPIIVVNKTGGTGQVGHTAGANAKPDGHTLTMMTVDCIILPKMGLGKTSYRAFKPVMLITFWGAGVQVRADAPWRTIDDLVADAKKNPKKYKVATIGPGGIWTVAAQGFEEQAGVQLTHVPFNGAGPGIVALLGGHVDIATGGVAEAWPQIEAGKLRSLGLMSEKRSSFYPDVQTLKEQGYDVVVGAWLALAVPKDTSDDRVMILHDAFKKALDSDTFKSLMKKRTLDIIYMGPKEFQVDLERQDKFFDKLVKSAQ